jgi:hypothetical protein
MPARLAPTTAAILLVLPLGAAVAGSAGHGRISDTEAQRTNRAAVTAIETWRADHGSYAGVTVERLAVLAPSLRDAPGLRLTRVSADGYRVATHATTGRTFRTTRRPRTGRVFFTCTPAGAGACRADGTWDRR